MDGNKCYVLYGTANQTILEIFQIGKELPMLKRIEEMFKEPFNVANKKLAAALIDNPETFFDVPCTSLKVRVFQQNYITVNVYSGVMGKVG